MPPCFYVFFKDRCIKFSSKMLQVVLLGRFSTICLAWMNLTLRAKSLYNEYYSRSQVAKESGISNEQLKQGTWFFREKKWGWKTTQFYMGLISHDIRIPIKQPFSHRFYSEWTQVGCELPGRETGSGATLCPEAELLGFFVTGRSHPLWN